MIMLVYSLTVGHLDWRLEMHLLFLLHQLSVTVTGKSRCHGRDWL